MPFLPIVSKLEIRDRGDSSMTSAGSLPTFYMNDYSVLGLRVSDCDAAFKLLANRRYVVTRRHGCRGVFVPAAKDIRKITGLLVENGLSGEIADLADQIYQG